MYCVKLINPSPYNTNLEYGESNAATTKDCQEDVHHPDLVQGNLHFAFAGVRE